MIYKKKQLYLDFEAYERVAEFPQRPCSCELSQSIKVYRAQQVIPHQVLP